MKSSHTQGEPGPELSKPGKDMPPAYHTAGSSNTALQPPYTPQYVVNQPGYNAAHPYGQNVVVTAQPTVVVFPMQSYVNDYLGYSIFTMLCCCLPIGIAALVFSINTRDANRRGDGEQASKDSRMALILNNVALGLGIVISIIWIACVIALLVQASSIASSNTYYG